MRRSLLIPALVLGLAAPYGAQVIKVPEQFATIQAALGAARAGSTILVGPGTYKENLVWPSADGIRLIARQGPPVTAIDGDRKGSVVRFGPGLTRATLLEGFTLTLGQAAYGAGVFIASSPTLRFNRIHGNLAAGGPGPALGGGVHIAAGAAPLLDRNRIEFNRGVGPQVFGAGVYVNGGSGAEILANIITDNHGDASFESQGAGICFDGKAAARVKVVGNVIAGNRISSPQRGLGGGVCVLGGPVGLLNNTIVFNDISRPTFGVGGGVYFAAVAQPDSRMLNNIVAANTDVGIWVDGLAPYLNYNDVWSNPGGDYRGVSPGPNDLSVNPGLVGAGDYHLAPTSPLIDAGVNLRVPRLVGFDLDGDPRFLDGRLRGVVARSDIGADEFSPVGLRAVTPPLLGRDLDFHVRGPAGWHFVVYWSPFPANYEIQPYGILLLNGFSFIDGGTLGKPVKIRVPAVGGLLGVPVLVQGLVMQGRAGAFTNRLDLTLLDAPRAVREDFTTSTFRDSLLTTAEWGPGRAGLHATFGYGGNGADGDLLVTANTVLDSSTRQPGPDGVVEWNFRLLNVRPAGVLTLTGRHPIRLNVLGLATVDGEIRLGGGNGLNAPAGKAGQVGTIKGGAGGPGGGAGGDSNTNPLNPIGSLPMELRGGPGSPRVLQRCNEPNRSENRLITVIESNCGGGTGGNRGLPAGPVFRSGCSGNGGGHATSGVQTDYLCSNIQAFGREFGVQWVIPAGPSEVTAPTAGAAGGGGGNAAIQTFPTPADDIVAGSAGGGGGGLEIVATESLAVIGKILADGGNGGMGYSTVVSNTTVSGGWGGGGAGGSVWLSGTSVAVTSNAALSALGGTGNPNPVVPARSGNGGDGYIIVRDRGGNPVISSSQIKPAPVAGRSAFDPAGNGQSVAVSLFYDSTDPDPQWAFDSNDPQTGEVKPGRDLTFLTPPAGGQKVIIDFQGAPDLNGQPNPNPATWFPQNGFEPDITKLRGKGLRHIRFRIRFDIGKRQKGHPAPSRAAVKELMLRY